MKRAISLILALLMALSMLAALADTEYTDKDTVKAVQQALNDAGFNCGTPDGAAGKKTKSAITDYQAANGLEQTGTIDDALLEALGLAGGEAEAGEEVAANEEAEITFQGVPWGSNQDDVLNILKTVEGVNKDAPIMEVGVFNNPLITNSDEKVLQTPYEIGLEYGTDAMYDGYDAPICGYTVDNIWFSFEDQQGFHLVGVSITLSNVEKDDLAKELTSIYGNPAEHSDGTLVWSGSNETAVCVDSAGTLVFGKVFASKDT